MCSHLNIHLSEFTAIITDNFLLYWCSRVMDSKWGGKTETINMKLNVEQVWENNSHNRLGHSTDFTLNSTIISLAIF